MGNQAWVFGLNSLGVNEVADSKFWKMEGMGMHQEHRLRVDEVQCALGHLRADLINANDEYKHGRMSETVLLDKIVRIRVAAKRFDMEYRGEASHAR